MIALLFVWLDHDVRKNAYQRDRSIADVDFVIQTGGVHLDSPEHVSRWSMRLEPDGNCPLLVAINNTHFMR